MPLFKKSSSVKREEEDPLSPGGRKSSPSLHHQVQKEQASVQEQRNRLVFHCQQAQGSPTGLISGFSNIRELYQKIAECYEFPASEVMGSPNPSTIETFYSNSSEPRST